MIELSRCNSMAVLPLMQVVVKRRQRSAFEIFMAIIPRGGIAPVLQGGGAGGERTHGKKQKGGGRVMG